MMVDATTLADAKQERDELWARKKEAEKTLENTAEGKRVKELESHWYRAKLRVDAMELLLKSAGEPLVVEEVQS